MAKKHTSRLQMRKEVDAAEARKTSDSKDGKEAKDGKKADAAKKPKRKPTARRSKEKAAQRKRLLWGVYSGSMKEEARFPYDQRGEAEKKVKQLVAKTAKTYFIQPIKEIITEPLPVAAE